MSEALPEPDPTLSLDANDSTYAQAPEDKEAQNPPSGPAVIQTLGKPGGAAVAATKTTRSSGSSSS